jgi:hypothetical protein
MKDTFLFDAKKAVCYFDLKFEDDNYNEDNPSVDCDTATKFALEAESSAIKEIEGMLKPLGVERVTPFAHNSDGSLDTSFGLDTAKQVKELYDFIMNSFGGGDDIIYLQAPYMEALCFTFFPQGVNGPRFRIGGNGDEDLELFLEAHNLG